MHPLDDVVAVAQLAQGRLSVVRECPLSRRDLAGEAKALQLAQPAHSQRMVAVRPDAGFGRHVDHAVAQHSPRQVAVDLGPAFGIDLPIQRLPDFEVGARAEFLGDDLARLRPHPLADIVARDDEVLPVFGDAAHDDVDVRVVGVPMLDRPPVQAGAEILFHPRHQLAGKALEVAHLLGVLGRDDEPEMMAVVLAARRKLVAVEAVRLRAEQHALFAVARDAIALQIIEMGSERGAAAMPDDARLHDDLARSAAEPVGRAHARHAAAAEGRAARRDDAATARDMTAGPLRGGERLDDDRQRALASPRADTPRPDAEIVVAAHGATGRNVRQTLMAAGVRPAPHSAGFPHTLRSNARKP